jgi:hydrogenase-4 membrane subunit HyfE
MTDSLSKFIGPISPPPGSANYGVEGIVPFLNNIIKLLITVAGIYVLFNLIIAGFQFINAGGDPKNVEKAWNKIWQSLIGLLIIAGSFVLAAIFGYLIFGDATAILSPKIYTP